MKQIILPTDFSKNAGNAFDWALMLARRSEATINLLHAYHFHVSENPTPEKLEMFEEKFKNLIDEARNKPGAGTFPTFKIWLRSELAADAIFNLSISLPADLVIMGTQGVGELEGLIMGSVTSKIVAESTVPVWVIPSKADFFVPETFVFATTLDVDQISSLKKIASIARFFDAQIEVVHIQTPSEKFDQTRLDQFEAELRKAADSGTFRFNLFQSISVEDGLAEFCEHKENAVICMVHEKRNFLSTLFERSHSKKMTLHSHIPLIIFPLLP